ncbi:MAG: hypothetical protein WBC33_12955 [Conexibacter sp.]
MSRLRRAAGFALVPLSVTPLLAVAPVMAPPIAQRLHELRGEETSAHARTAPCAVASCIDVLRVAPLEVAGR